MAAIALSPGRASPSNQAVVGYPKNETALGLRELLEWYVFSYDSIYEDPGILEEDYELHEEANEIADNVYRDRISRAQRTVAVGKIKETEQKVITTSFGQFTRDQETEYRERGYLVPRLERGSGDENHAEKRMIRWAEGQGYEIEAIGVSHKGGICSTCWPMMQEKEIRRGSLLKP